MKKWRAFFEQSKYFLTVSLLMIITFCFTMFQGSFVSWFIFFTVSPFLVYSFIFLLVKEKIIRVERQIETGRVESGQSAKVTVNVERKTFFPFAYMVIEELVNNEELIRSKEKGKRSVTFVGFKRKFEWNYTLEDLPRGEHKFLGVEIVFYDFFGWAQKRILVEKEQMLLVYPRVKEMKYVALQTKLDVGTMTSPYSVVKDTSMAVGLREYVPGDRFSWIHWKSFARTQKLQSKEFEDRQSQELLLMLHTDPSPLFEEKVELVASMVQTIVRGRGELSFVSTSHPKKVFSLIQSEIQLDQVMHYLATIQPVEDEDRYWQQNNKQIATLLYVTSTVTEELLQTLSSVVKSCICFVVAEEPLSIAAFAQRFKQIQIIHVNPENYTHLFTEVMKP